METIEKILPEKQQVRNIIMENLKKKIQLLCAHMPAVSGVK